MIELPKKHDFFVGIDSDGCAFDTMEVKHKECFIPNIIEHYHLAGVSKYAREAAEFVNLYSKSRGVNRFPALVETFDWLRRRPEVRRRGFEVPAITGVAQWIEQETKLGNPALARAVEESGDADLKQALAWSEAVNTTIGRVVHGVPPFPYVRECLERMNRDADLVVVSATPNEALEREWQEHDLADFVVAICGQETGSKAESLAAAKNYEPNASLMIGDSPGDYRAAQKNEVLFFPILPGREDTSWKQLFDEGIERFLSGKFAGEYQQALLDEFDRSLPEQPPWPVED